MYGVAELDRPEWIGDAACRGLGPSLFYDWETTRGERSRQTLAEARATCATCPVQYECLAFALTTLDPSHDQGMWGGTTPEQRVRLRRSRRSA